MLFTRLLSIILRVAQFVFAAVVLGLTAYFMYARQRRDVGPFGRTIFAIVWSSLSILFSIIWMIPTKSTIMSYGSDLRTYFLYPPTYVALAARSGIQLTHHSLHSRLGRRLCRASHLVQRCRLR